MRTIVNISIICFLKVFLNLAITLQKQNFVGRKSGIFQTTYFNFSKDVLFLQLAAGEEMSFPLLFVPALSISTRAVNGTLRNFPVPGEGSY